MPAIAHQNKILGNTSGGGSTILVTTSESSLYGQTVSLTDGATTMNGTFSNTGECEFTGVMMVGTLTASSGGASTSIQVPYFGVYSMTLSFFSATITATFPSGATCTCVGNGETYTASTSPHTFTVHGAATYTVGATIDGASKQTSVVISTDGQTASVALEFGTIVLTYDNDFRGKTITCTKGGAQTITKTAPSSGNTMYFYPPTTGNWTISGTVSSDTFYSTPNPIVVSSLSTSVSATLETIPDGSTKTPTDDVSIWLSCAGISDKAYTTLSDVLADSETFNALLGDSNACAYMARSTTWTTDICASQYAMSMIGQYDVCCDALLGNETWVSAIINSSYADYVITAKVPTMTSNTTPSGECFGTARTDSQASTYAPWKAFDGSTSTMWTTNNGVTPPAYIGYKFTAPVDVYVVSILESTQTSYGVDTDVILQGSIDGSTNFVDIQTLSLSASQFGQYQQFVITGGKGYTGYQLKFPTQNFNAENGYCVTAELQFYGRKTSSEKIHGTNNESAYYLDGATQTPIVDPSTLSAGTYTFGSTVAKDPSDLTADYTKTIRITPNTKEIVLRPDNALYWWGYESANLEEVSTANGWSTQYGFVAPSFSTYYVNLNNSATWGVCGVSNKNAVTIPNNICCIGQGISKSDVAYQQISLWGSKALSGSSIVNAYSTTTNMEKISASASATGYLVASTTVANANLYALWYE